MATPDVTLAISGNADGLVGALDRAQDKVHGFASKASNDFQSVGREVSHSLEGISNGLNMLGRVTGLAVAFEVLEKIGGLIEKLGSRATQIHSMSDVLGVTAIQFQAMGLAAEEAGVGNEKLFQAAEKLSQLLTEARNHSGEAIATLRELGITTEQLGDKNFTLADLLSTLSGRLNDSSTAAATMHAITHALGARGSLAAEAIKQLSINTEEWGDRAKEINGLSDDQVKTLSSMSSKWHELGETIANTTSKALIWMSEVGQRMQRQMDNGNFVTANPIVAFFSSLGGGSSGGPVRGPIDRPAAGGAGAPAAAAESAVTKDVLDALQVRLNAEKEGSAQRLALAREYAAKAKQFYGDDQVQEVREANRRVVEETRSRNAELLKVETRHVADLEALGRSGMAYVSEVLTQANHAMDEVVKTADIASETTAKLGELDLARTVQILDLKLQAGLISNTAMLDAQREAEETSYRIQLEALSRHLELSKYDVVEHARTLQEKELLQKKHQDALAILAQKGANAQMAPLNSFFRSMTAGWDNGIARILGGQLRLKTGVAGALQGIGDAVDQMIARTIMALLKGLAMQVLFHKKGVLADAYKAGAGAYQAMVGIPYVGPFIAPVAAAVAFSAVAAFGDGISARGGYDIPAGANPMVQTHEREMILPAHIADPLRASLAGGGVAVGGQQFSVTIQAIDTQSGADFLRKNSREIARSLSRHMREFGRA